MRDTIAQNISDFRAYVDVGDIDTALDLVPSRPSRGWLAAITDALERATEDGHVVTGAARKRLQRRVRAIPAVLYNPNARVTCTRCGRVSTQGAHGARWTGTRAIVDPNEWTVMAETVLSSAKPTTIERVLASLREGPDGWTAEIPTVQNRCPPCRRVKD